MNLIFIIFLITATFALLATAAFCCMTRKATALSGKTVQFELSKSTIILKTALSSVGAGAFEYDIKTNREVWSEELERIYGLTPGEYDEKPRSWEHFVHPDDLRAVKEGFLEGIKSGRGHSCFFRIRRKDTGEIRCLELKSTVLVDTKGRPAKVIGVNIDVTEKQAKEYALKESEDRFRTLANTLPQLAWITGPDGSIRWYNDRWYAYTGLSKEDSLGWGWKDCLHPDHIERVETLFKKHVAEGTPWEDKFSLRSHDGRWRWFLSRAVPVRDPVGNIQCWYGANTDITDEMETKSELERTARKLRQLQNVSNSLAQCATPAQVADVLLLKAEKLFGISGGVLIVKSPDKQRAEIVSTRNYPDDFQKVWVDCPMEKPIPSVHALRTGEAYFFESPESLIASFPESYSIWGALSIKAFVAIPLKVNNRTVAAAGLFFYQKRSFSDDEKTHFQTIANQCAQALERTFLYQREVKRRNELQKALDVRDEFLSIASHELKTPLTTLTLQSQLLQRKIEKAGTASVLSTNDFKRFASQVERQTGRLTQLVTDMLDISRIRGNQLSLNKETVDLSKLTFDFIERFRPVMTDAGSELLLLSSGPVLCEIDQTRIEQVLANFLNNAMKYASKSTVRVEVTKEGNTSVVSVTDTGMGIVAEDINRIFEKFERGVSKDEASGLGLGLYICKEIVLAHGGEIGARSDGPGQGATFFFKIPLKRSNDPVLNSEKDEMPS